MKLNKPYMKILINALFVLLFICFILSHQGIANIRYFILFLGLFNIQYFLKVIKSDVSKAILAFFFVSALSLYFNDVSLDESVRVLNWYLAFFAGCFFAFNVDRDKIINIAFYSYVVSYIVLFVLQTKYGSITGYENSRYVGLQPSYNSNGELIGIGIIFLTFLLIKAYNNKHYFIVIANLLLIFASIPIIMETGSRTAFFITAFISVIMLFFEISNKKFSIILLTLIVVIFTATFQDKIKDSRIFENITKPMSIPSLKSRLPVFNSAWNCFKEKPLFGYGFTNFDNCFKLQRKIMVKKYEIVEKSVPHAHNLFLQFLSETGFFGFLIMMYIIFRGIYTSIRRFKLAFYLMAALLLYFMLNMNLYLREISTIFFLLVGMSVTLSDKKLLSKRE